jgi:hypothetical protein
VIVERAKVYDRPAHPKNVIIEYENPRVNVEKQVYDEGIIRVDPNTYNRTGVNGELRIVDRITDLPIPNATSYQPPANLSSSVPYTTQVNTSLSDLSRVNTTNYLTSSAPVARGPASYVGPWNTTYRSSYTGRGFPYFRS